jgi:flagellar basal body P-ring formation protein FlgA
MKSSATNPATMLTRRAQRCACVVGILTLAAGTLTPRAYAQSPAWQSPESIRAAARALVQRALGAPASTTIETNTVDDRLRLPVCAQPLDAQLQRDLINGQGTVAVSCPGVSPWRLFVPVRVIEQVTVVVARRTLTAGAVLTAEDVETRTQASTSLPSGFLSNPEAAIGLTVRRSVPAGTLLAPAALVYPELIERGSLVTIVSGRGTVHVRSEGVALEGARVKERVRVRSPSGRVVEGVVEASGEVRVGT